MIPDAIFRAYDIRGIYPSEINERIVAELTPKIIKFFRNNLKLKTKKLKFIIGYDARLSSPALYYFVIKGIKNYELEIRNKKKTVIHNSSFIILPAGLITTPMLYFLVNKHKASGGIMITASHNPKQFNGLKIVGPKGTPVSGKEICDAINYKKRIPDTK
ncbi:MAG: hypothetical protein QMD86_01055 [Patescibacteria group bacterium]|nr:hypothetical protein [Patescibacteria group bacterium]